jgi:hypothetical protein
MTTPYVWEFMYFARHGRQSYVLLSPCDEPGTFALQTR